MAEVTQAEHGWTYIGPDGEWHWSREFDNHESCEGHRPATAVEAALVADERRHRTEAVKPLVEALNNARERFVLALAFIGRDRGTERFDKTIDGLLKEFANADNELLAALRGVQS